MTSTRFAVLTGLLFAVGWMLVFVSGYGGDSTGGSELVGRIGGLMVYASIPLGLAVVVFSVLTARHRQSRAAGKAGR